jgi:hypothetical protein
VTEAPLDPGERQTERLAWLLAHGTDVAAAYPPGFLYRQRQLVVRSADVRRVRAVVGRRVRSVEELQVAGFARLHLTANADALAMVRSVADKYGEALATPNHVFRGEAAYPGGKPAPPRAVAFVAPPVPRRGSGPRPRVAVLDTGWVLHRWLWRTPYNIDLDPAQAESPLDLTTLADGGLAGHGTFVAGLVLRVCPDARIDFRRVLDHAGLCDEVQLATALDALCQAHDGVPDVVLIPAGGYTLTDRISPVLDQSLAAIGDRAVVIAAAGNAGIEDRPFWPAAADQVIAVGALTQRGQPAPFTNRGQWIEAAAVGTDLESAFPDLPRGRIGPAHVADGYARWSGTSFAAAMVAGVVASKVAAGQDARSAAAAMLDGAGPAGEVGPAARRIPTPLARPPQWWDRTPPARVTQPPTIQPAATEPPPAPAEPEQPEPEPPQTEPEPGRWARLRARIRPTREP